MDGNEFIDTPKINRTYQDSPFELSMEASHFY